MVFPALLALRRMQRHYAVPMPVPRKHHHGMGILQTRACCSVTHTYLRAILQSSGHCSNLSCHADMHAYRGLPEGATTWDLSTFLVNGAPATYETVHQWLSLVYSTLSDEPFKPPSELQELTRLMLLADALGTNIKFLRKHLLPSVLALPRMELRTANVVLPSLSSSSTGGTGNPSSSLTTGKAISTSMSSGSTGSTLVIGDTPSTVSTTGTASTLITMYTTHDSSASPQSTASRCQSSSQCSTLHPRLIWPCSLSSTLPASAPPEELRAMRTAIAEAIELALFASGQVQFKALASRLVAYIRLHAEARNTMGYILDLSKEEVPIAVSDRVMSLMPTPRQVLTHIWLQNNS
jgi:hypothetical protein